MECVSGRIESFPFLTGFGLLRKQEMLLTMVGLEIEKEEKMYRTLVGFRKPKRGKMHRAVVGYGDQKCTEPWWGFAIRKAKKCS
jgi:hypothetical protein